MGVLYNGTPWSANVTITTAATTVIRAAIPNFKIVLLRWAITDIETANEINATLFWSGTGKTIALPKIAAATIGQRFSGDLEEWPVHRYSGTATGATATTLVDTGKAFVVDALIGKTVQIHSGTGNGQTQTITDNDATSITVADWAASPIGDPASGSTYSIYDVSDLAGISLTTDANATSMLFHASGLIVPKEKHGFYGDMVG